MTPKAAASTVGFCAVRFRAAVKPWPEARDSTAQASVKQTRKSAATTIGPNRAASAPNSDKATGTPRKAELLTNAPAPAAMASSRLAFSRNAALAATTAVAAMAAM